MRPGIRTRQEAKSPPLKKITFRTDKKDCTNEDMRLALDGHVSELKMRKVGQKPPAGHEGGGSQKKKGNRRP